MPLSAHTLVAISVLLVFLHGGVLAAPLSYGPIAVNATPSDEDAGTLVHIDIAPQGPLDFADFAVVQQTSVQSVFEAGGSFLESVTGFFHRLTSRFYPHQPQHAPAPV
jgi:hypothetical protein